MFKNIGLTELIIIAVLLIILLAGKRLPGVGKGLGDSIREFKDALGDKKDRKDK